MGLFDQLFNKKTQPTFTKVKEEKLTLSNQNGTICNPTKEDLKNYLNCLFDEDDQFITLTLPKAKNGVSFVQATFAKTKLIVQLGLEKNDTTYLVEKVCTSSKECVDIFYQFYNFGNIENINEYTPVQF